MEILNKLIKNEELVCSKVTKSKGCDLIHFLAKNSNEEILFETLKLYLEKYPDTINLKNELGWTPLMIASRNSNTTSSLETVELLLENDADPNLINKFEWTALMFACRNSNTDSNMKTVELLLKYDANPNLKDINGRTALITSCRYLDTDSNIETVKLLLEYGAQYNLKDDIVCDRFFEEHPELLNKKNCDKEEIILKITELLKSL